MTTRDEAFAKLGQGHQLDEECKRIIAEEWGFKKIVRCKDCKNRECCHDPVTGKIRNDMFFCKNIGYSSRFEFFCVDGERKECE